MDENEEQTPLPTFTMLGLALVVGVVGGYGSIAFLAILAFIHNLFFYGQLSLQYNADTHMAATPWGPAIIFVPVAGAIIVTWITNRLAPETRGHGVPEVMNAIYYNQGRIRPVVVFAKALSSAVSIGTGGSVGREGPIVQIGSAFGSTLGQIVTMPTRQRVVLVGAGAAAGIAATFNAPIGGLAFAIELMLVSISAHSVSIVAVATVAATYISRLHFGLAPSFHIPELQAFNTHVVGLETLVLCVLLGLLMGLASAGFIRLLYWAEDSFDRMISNPYARHMAGMLVVGLTMYAFMYFTGKYYVGGVGYATIIDILTEVLSSPLLLLLLFAGKLLSTCLTIGSGASGGVFSPSLFLGATAGSALAYLGDAIFPGVPFDPVLFAVAGMAAMVSGTTGAVITAITMLFEQTRDYAAILPIIVTVSLAYLVRSRLSTESIYTLKLARRGLVVPQGLQAAITSTRTAETIMSRSFDVVDYQDLGDWIAQHQPGKGARYAVAVRDGSVYGIAREELRYLMNDENPEGMINKNFLVVEPGTKWSVLLRAMQARNTDRVLVCRDRKSRDPEDLRGVITTRELVNAARQSADLLE